MLFIDNENPEDSNYEEIGITFSAQGIIQNVYITIQREQYNKIVRGMSEVKDENNRLTILSWMEALATAYHEKDIPSPMRPGGHRLAQVHIQRGDIRLQGI